MTPLQLAEYWKSSFGILDTVGAGPLFWVMLMAARSASHLEKLHDLLPEDCKLLRDDLVAFKAFWKLLWGSKLPKGRQQRLPEQSAQVALSRFLPERGMWRYYAICLERGRKGYSKVGHVPIFSVPINKLELGQSWAAYQAKLYGVDCLILIFLDEDKGVLNVGVEVPRYELTESFTHLLLNLPPSRCYTVEHKPGGNDPPCFWYELDVEDRTICWKPRHGVRFLTSSPMRALVAEPLLKGLIENDLNDLGVPVTDFQSYDPEGKGR